MNNENNNDNENIEQETENKNWWEKLLQSKKIIICFSIVLIIILCKLGYEQYKIYDFQKRYKEAPSGSLVKTGNMIRSRSEHTNILLKDGNVLVIGGNNGAEIFNPKTGKYKLINDKIEQISFNVHNYFVLDNGNILIANKYIFDISKYKFIQLNQDNSLYNNLTLSGYSPAMSNVYDIDMNTLIMPFLNHNLEFYINCYTKSLNKVTSCKMRNDFYKYFFPLNKVFYLNNNKYIILVSFDPYDYIDKFNTAKSLQEEVSAKLILWDSKKNVFNIIQLPNIFSYNIQTAILDKNYIWIVDKNLNLYSISTENFNSFFKTKLTGNPYFTRLFKIGTDTLLIVCPIYTRPSVLKFIYFNTKKNEIVKTIEFQYRYIQSSDFRTRKSYDIVQLQNQDLLINGGQAGTYAPTTKTNESYLLKE